VRVFIRDNYNTVPPAASIVNPDAGYRGRGEIMGSDPNMGPRLAVSGWRLGHSHFPAFFAAVFASIAFCNSLIRCSTRNFDSGVMLFSSEVYLVRAASSFVPAR